jgi:hypothetical protein
MNLMELCKSLEPTLAQLEAARRGAQDGEAIDQRMQQWKSELADLQSSRQRADWLRIELSQVPLYPEQFAYTRQLAEQAAQRLVVRPDIEALTEEDLWVRLLQTAQKTAGTAWAQVKRTWAQRVEEFRQLTPSHQLRATASPLPQNDAPLADHEVHYHAASRFAAMEVPKSAGDPEAFANSIDACRSLAAKLRFDAPAEVEVFFRAINAGGASLALVTPTVLAWLAENDQLGRYTVRGSGR